MGLISPTSFQWLDGDWQPISGIPLTDRGFRHGMSAFETIKIHRGKGVLVKEHLEKLRATCARLGLCVPPEEIGLLHSDWPAGMARIYVTAGDGAFRDPINVGRMVLLMDETPARQPPAGLTFAKSAPSPAWAGLKTGNYWTNIDAFREAGTAGVGEAVLVSSSNHVISASLANLFAVIDGLLLTPRVSTGARAGVMRDWVLAREEVVVADFHPEQLRDAEEIFLTSSGYGIAPVATLDGKSVPGQSRGQNLRATYLDWLEKI